MSEIFPNAVSVLVWPGTAADSSDCAMNSLSGLVPRFRASQQNYDIINLSNAETFGLPGLTLRTVDYAAKRRCGHQSAVIELASALLEEGYIDFMGLVEVADQNDALPTCCPDLTASTKASMSIYYFGRKDLPLPAVWKSPNVRILNNGRSILVAGVLLDEVAKAVELERSRPGIDTASNFEDSTYRACAESLLRLDK